MPMELIDFCQLRLRDLAIAELNYIRNLGTNRDLTLATANLGAYEALLYIVSSNECGVPVYEALTNVKSSYSTQSGILLRLKAMRQLGLIEDGPGKKRSQTHLKPSQSLLNQLGMVLVRRHEERV